MLSRYHGARGPICTDLYTGRAIKALRPRDLQNARPYADVFDLDQMCGTICDEIYAGLRVGSETDFEKLWYKCSADAAERPIIVQGARETCMVETSHLGGDWRRDLKVKIAWTLAAKLLGLLLLWFLFFRGNRS
jgi:hypothetical protein